ncbi:MAG: 50S ribosomal protein L32 [Syntrophales bacterium]
MPNPVKRHSRTRRNMRRAHDFLTPTEVNACPQCGQAKLSHHACSNCGTYKGREVLSLKKTS